MPITVHTHIPPAVPPCIHPFGWFIMWDQLKLVRVVLLWVETLLKLWGEKWPARG